MSLGNTYNNNQNSKTSNLSVYSAYRMNNAESKIDATCITFRFWAGNLCISIFPRKNTGNDEVLFDMDNGITIYMSHTKARIFKHEVEIFLSDPVKYNSVGVPSGQAVITISNGAEYGKDNPVITIRKINSDTGEVIASFAYEFKRDYHFSIRNYNDRDRTFESCYEDYQNIEIEQLITLLDEYIKASTNAIAFTVVDQQKYSLSRMEDKINAIAANLGVELPNKGGNKRRYNGNTFFNNSNSSNSGGGYSSNINYGSATIDDLE